METRDKHSQSVDHQNQVELTVSHKKHDQYVKDGCLWHTDNETLKASEVENSDVTIH